jgi:hypothetical protein
MLSLLILFLSHRNLGLAGPTGTSGRDCDIPIVGQVCQLMIELHSYAFRNDSCLY